MSVLVRTVLLRGWPVDPDTDAAVTVDLSVDGTPTTTATASEARWDLANPGFGPYRGYSISHGFVATVPVPGGSYRVCATGRNVTGTPGTAMPLGCQTVTVPTPASTVFGAWDGTGTAPGGVTVRGWEVGS